MKKTMNYKQDIITIDPQLVLESERNPRTEFDAQALDELAQSIAQNGLINPITVRAVNGGVYEVVCGARRLRAFKIAREKYALKSDAITAIVIDESECALERIRLVENLQRKDLTTAEEARSIKALQEAIDEKGNPIYASSKELAKAIGRSVSFVNDRLRIAELERQTQAKIDELPVDVGRKIARLPVDVREDVLKKFLGFKEYDPDKSDDECFLDAIRECGHCPDDYFNFKIDEEFSLLKPCTKCEYFIHNTCLNEECLDKKRELADAEFKQKFKGEIEAYVKERWPRAKIVFADRADTTYRCLLSAYYYREILPAGVEIKPEKYGEIPILCELLPSDYDGELIVPRLPNRPEAYDYNADDNGELIESTKTRVPLEYLHLPSIDAVKELVLNSPRFYEFFERRGEGDDAAKLAAKKEKALSTLKGARERAEQADARAARAGEIVAINLDKGDFEREAFARVLAKLAGVLCLSDDLRLCYNSVADAIGVKPNWLGEKDKVKISDWIELISQCDKRYLTVKTLYLPFAFVGLFGDDFRAPDYLPAGLSSPQKLFEKNKQKWADWEATQAAKIEERFSNKEEDK